MKRKTCIRLLAALSLTGSFVVFYGTNLVLSDVSNMFYRSVTKDVVSSLPIFFVMLDFVLATIAVMRLYSRPQYRKKECLLYTTLLSVFSCLGIISVLLTGAWIYGSFLVPYPFPGAILLSLAWHIAGLASGILYHKRAARLPEDAVKRRMRISYVFFTVVLSVLIFFSYDRFGAVLWMPVYVQARTLSLTFPFYLSLLLPMALLFHMIFYIFAPKSGNNEEACREVTEPAKEAAASIEERKKNETISAFRNQLSVNGRRTIRYLTIILFANFILAAWVGIVGSRNTLFVSAVSPALAIERLATIPIDTIVHFALVFLLDVYCLIHAVRLEKHQSFEKRSIK